jgi:hypothetical protein
LTSPGPRRLHGFELMDLPWWPSALRDAATDYLQALLNHTQPFKPVTSVLEEALRRASCSRIVDLCSGGAGPWEILLPELRERVDPAVEVVLTDLYPNAQAAARCADQPGIHYELEPVDALSVPAHLGGVRTVVNGFHHFRPAQAQQLLADAVGAGQPIVVLELLQRTWPDLLASAVMVPLSVATTVPRIRPRALRTWALTYLAPVLPWSMAFDTVVSTLRCYRPDELLELAAGVAGADVYEWRAEALRSESGLPVTYLVGLPPERTEPLS